MKIITFNLRLDKPDPGNNAWTFRRNLVAQLIAQSDADLIGIQEGQAHQLLDLHRRLPDYQSIGVDRIGNGLGEHCAIFYNQQRLRCLNQGNFWLSETPNLVGSITSYWENPVPRMVSWGIFSILGLDSKIALVNTHFDYHSTGARDLSAELIWNYLGSMNTEEYFLIVTGDFNAEPGSQARKTFLNPLKNGVQLCDALADLDLPDQMTYHEFTGQAFAAVDTIYYDSRLKLKQVTIDRSSIEDILPSDHFPVIAEFHV